MCVKISANQVYVGESVILQCVHFLTEQPVNVLMWKVNGSLLRNDRISIDPPATLSKLTLWKAQLSDSGNYSCITRLDNRSQVAYVQFRVYSKTPRIHRSVYSICLFYAQACVRAQVHVPVSGKILMNFPFHCV